MVIYTNTPRLMHYRKLILELLLAAHCRDCTTCIKSGECHLQELAHRLGVHEVRFENVREMQPIDTSSPAIIRDPNKCILCGDCVRMCDNIQNINAIDFAYRGTDALVTPAFNKKIAETNCGKAADNAELSVRQVRSVFIRILIRYGKRWQIRIRR